MTNELICFDCLTDDNQQVLAVTTVNGTAVCEKCARERAEQLAEISSFVPPSPVMGRSSEPRIGGF